jgi:transposase
VRPPSAKWSRGRISHRHISPIKSGTQSTDQAGWHLSKTLEGPDNITLLPVPPKSPKLNPVENTWQFIRDNWLSSRIFTSYQDILGHCRYACNSLIE